MSKEITLTPPFSVVCIDTTKKPVEIPFHKWLVKDKQYTVIDVRRCSNTGILFVLNEIDLDDTCFPYEGFNPNRFGIILPEELEESINEEELLLHEA